MGSFMTNRFAGGNTHHILKQDLITQAKQRCHELGGNAIVECKMAISRGKYCTCIKVITFTLKNKVKVLKFTSLNQITYVIIIITIS